MNVWISGASTIAEYFSVPSETKLQEIAISQFDW